MGVRKTLQSAAFSAVSNVLGQIISAVPSKESISMDPLAVIRFASWTCLFGPVVGLWQALLDQHFPTNITKENSKQTVKEKSQSNLLIKVVLTETIFSIVANGIFVIYISLLEHGNLQLTLENLDNVPISLMCCYLVLIWN